MAALRRVPVLLLLALAAGCGARPAPEPVLIAQLMPLSGPHRGRGEEARQGARLAVHEAVAEGQTVLGRPIKVLHVESPDDAAAVRAEVVRLVTVNRVAALLTGPDADQAERVVRAARPYLGQAGGLGAVVVPGELPEPAPGPGVVSLGAPPDERGRLLARYAAGALRAKRAIVLGDSRSPVAAALAAAFVKAWPRGESFAVEEHACASEAEQAAAVRQTVGSRPDIVLVAVPADAFVKMRERLREGGVKAPLLYGGPDVGVAALKRGPAEGDVYLATVYDRAGLSARGKEFARAYEERFGGPPDLFAASAYDATRLLLTALHTARSPTVSRLRKALAAAESFESVTGPVSWQDGRPRRRVFVVRLRGGRAEVTQTVEPGGGGKEGGALREGPAAATSKKG